ncbi:hypothetical protein DC498_14115 [Terrimonas sp.]|nr:hypothetical protein DC498_14115 [Terrimonas sp.]
MQMFLKQEIGTKPTGKKGLQFEPPNFPHSAFAPIIWWDGNFSIEISPVGRAVTILNVDKACSVFTCVLLLTDQFNGTCSNYYLII